MTRNERRLQKQRKIAAAAAAILFCLAAVAGLLSILTAPPAAEAVENSYTEEPAQPVTVVTAVSADPTSAEDPAEYLAKTIWGEARGCSTTEQAAVVWCVLNRVDDESGLWPDDIISVVTQPAQFCGYDPENPVLPELYSLAEDVLDRWRNEHMGIEGIGRILPAEYTYFDGDGVHNYFTTEWGGGSTWDWSIPSPYEDAE